MPQLPARPSMEHLRKAAKRLAKERSLGLAEAQRILAGDYGFRSWVDLRSHVMRVRAEMEHTVTPLYAAAASGDLDAVRGALESGANPRVLGDGNETPLHAAARRGSLAIVETLIEHGALEWVTARDGRLAADVAREGTSPEHAAIAALLERREIVDPSFRAAVEALHAGDANTLARLLDAEPRLLHERIREPDVYRKASTGSKYFLDPKLFWFVANNPTLVERMPANIVELAQLMIDRGVEQADLDYALGLTMTSGVAREQGHQIPLMRTLLAAGAVATLETILTTAAHWELGALRALLDFGAPTTAPIAAALGETTQLAALIASASPAEIQDAFALAVINRHVENARIALAAGADVNAFLPVHAHSTPLHQAAANNDVPMIEFLLAHGANTEARDTLWDGTPLGWAHHVNHADAIAALEPVSRER